MANNYRDLNVWKKAIQLVKRIYKASQNFPKHEIYGLTSQIRRAAVTIVIQRPTNNDQRITK